jgi:hypothetical protein
MQYRVDFVPDIDHMGVRKALVRQHESKIGKYIFDGTLLYCVKRVAQVKLPLSILWYNQWLMYVFRSPGKK